MKILKFSYISFFSKTIEIYKNHPELVKSLLKDEDLDMLPYFVRNASRSELEHILKEIRNVKLI